MKTSFWDFPTNLSIQAVIKGVQKLALDVVLPHHQRNVVVQLVDRRDDVAFSVGVGAVLRPTSAAHDLMDVQDPDVHMLRLVLVVVLGSLENINATRGDFLIL